MGQAERPFPGEPVEIFFTNLWDAMTMLVWNNGSIGAHSIPFRPALGMVAGALFVVGVVLLILRYLRRRNWLDIFLLTSIPLLMMPSVLSLAFPDENPSLNRTGGALVIVFLIVGMAFDGLLNSLKSSLRFPVGKYLPWAVGSILLALSAFQNYELVFNQFARQSQSSAWNTSELGSVIRDFAEASGSEDSAWVVPSPHWVDTRLVGIRAGFPNRDYALRREDIIETVDDPRTKLYLSKPEDTETLHLLKKTYPEGTLRFYVSKVEGRDFYVYSVPAKK